MGAQPCANRSRVAAAQNDLESPPTDEAGHGRCGGPKDLLDACVGSDVQSELLDACAGGGCGGGGGASAAAAGGEVVSLVACAHGAWVREPAVALCVAELRLEAVSEQQVAGDV